MDKRPASAAGRKPIDHSRHLIPVFAFPRRHEVAEGLRLDRHQLSACRRPTHQGVMNELVNRDAVVSASAAKVGIGSCAREAATGTAASLPHPDLGKMFRYDLALGSIRQAREGKYVESRRFRGGQLQGMCVCVAALIAALTLTVAPAAKAATPVLEFVAPGTAFPIDFTASGGPVTTALAGFDTEVHCSDSEGDGAITGPGSTVSSYAFTGCKGVGGGKNGAECKSEGANAEEITADAIEADLVYIDQAKHEVGMLLNPDGGVYMKFKCGGELVEASGPFLSPVGPINKEVTSFTATLSRLGAVQTPDEYENAIGEKRPAIPMGKREANPSLATTGVELSFTINTSAPLQIKAITAAEIEAKQHEDEVAAEEAAKKRQDEEAAAAAAAKKRQDAETAAATAVKKRQEEETAAATAATKRQEEEAQLEQLRRALLSSTLKQCRKKARSQNKRVRCEARAKKQYGSAKLR